MLECIRCGKEVYGDWKEMYEHYNELHPETTYGIVRQETELACLRARKQRAEDAEIDFENIEVNLRVLEKHVAATIEDIRQELLRIRTELRYRKSVR